VNPKSPKNTIIPNTLLIVDVIIIKNKTTNKKPSPLTTEPKLLLNFSIKSPF
jgi:hypothetical protein